MEPTVGRSCGMILLPLAQPALATVAIFSFLTHWNDFFHPLIYLSTVDSFPLSVGLRWFQQAANDPSEPRDHLLMAASMLMVLPCVADLLHHAALLRARHRDERHQGLMFRGCARPAARDQALRPQARRAAGAASATERAPEPRGRVEVDARLRAGRLRQDDAAGRVAGSWLRRRRRGPRRGSRSTRATTMPASFWTLPDRRAADGGTRSRRERARAAAVAAAAADRNGPGHAAQRARRDRRTTSCWCSTTTTSSTRATFTTGWPSCSTTSRRGCTW